MRVFPSLLGLAVLFYGPAFAAGDIEAGRKIMMGKCQVCHGRNGLATLPDAPNIAAQKADYLIRVLTAFKTGERQHPMMTVVAQELSDQDIADVAAYYSAIKITVGPLP